MPSSREGTDGKHAAPCVGRARSAPQHRSESLCLRSVRRAGDNPNSPTQPPPRGTNAGHIGKEGTTRTHTRGTGLMTPYDTL